VVKTGIPFHAPAARHAPLVPEGRHSRRPATPVLQLTRADWKVGVTSVTRAVEDDPGDRNVVLPLVHHLLANSELGISDSKTNIRGCSLFT
jgi:hypothetical protein